MVVPLCVFEYGELYIISLTLSCGVHGKPMLCRSNDAIDYETIEAMKVDPNA
jgi:hypothetical protein